MKIDVRKAVTAATALVVLFVFSFTLYGIKARQGAGSLSSEAQTPESYGAQTFALDVQAEQAPEAEEDLTAPEDSTISQETPVEEVPEEAKAEPVKEPETKSTITAAKKPVQTAAAQKSAKTTTAKKTVQTKVASRGSTTAAKAAGTSKKTTKPSTSTTAAKPTSTPKTAAPAKTAATTAVAPSSKGSKIVETAKQYLGKPYVYGAEGPSSFDCSGLTMYVLGKVEISIPRTSKSQSTAGQYVPKEQLQTGDLVFFTTDGTGGISHVGIYAGNGQFIHAPRTGDVVRYTSMSSGYYSSRYVTARRFK